MSAGRRILNPSPWFFYLTHRNISLTTKYLCEKPRIQLKSHSTSYGHKTVKSQAQFRTTRICLVTLLLPHGERKNEACFQWPCFSACCMRGEFLSHHTSSTDETLIVWWGQLTRKEKSWIMCCIKNGLVRLKEDAELKTSHRKESKRKVPTSNVPAHGIIDTRRSKRLKNP